MENYENPVNTSPVDEYNFALWYACKYGRKRLVKTLLAEGVNVLVITTWHYDWHLGMGMLR